MTELLPRIQTTQYVVSCLPVDHIDHITWSVTVEFRGHGGWAVLRGRRCLGRDGKWDNDCRDPYDGWLEAHRFTEQEALQLAVEWAPKIRSNGLTTADVLARIAGQS